MKPPFLPGSSLKTTSQKEIFCFIFSFPLIRRRALNKNDWTFSWKVHRITFHPPQTTWKPTTMAESGFSSFEGFFGVGGLGVGVPPIRLVLFLSFTLSFDAIIVEWHGASNISENGPQWSSFWWDEEWLSLMKQNLWRQNFKWKSRWSSKNCEPGN